MAIDSVSGSVAASYTQFSSTGAVAPRGQDSDGDNDGSTGRTRGVGGGVGGGRIANAIAQALSQLGGTASTSATGATGATDATGASGDTKQAESAFAQSLFAALHAQSASAGNGPGAAPGGAHHQHGGGGGRLAAGLQSLAQQLSSSTSSTSGTSGSGSSQALSDLQTSFDKLLAANGQSGSGATLSQFLQSLSQNLQGAASSGNVVSTKA
ncbi:hypothetical protein H3H36_20230 [Duganella sp. FT3S]|uniref:Uncharacterized protein n=1 Tax=Rugamonas fusca TaxID=2758568 RepID=A0A7W2EKM9_9BURK|nr:hypothetical protein [Rugamonas fusca]MBA5607689.1 hypothetical protein [Rugamonas fusca]